MVKRFLLRTGLGVAVWASACVAQAQVSVAFDNFTYAGTVTRYATLADAQNQVSPTGGPYTIVTVSNGPRNTRPDARDGDISVTNTAPPAYGPDSTFIATAWYFTTNTLLGDGWGNPNNTNNGFIQYYLASSPPTVTGGWQPGHTQFLLTVAGGNGDDFNAARLWPAPHLGGAAAISRGAFIEFNLNLTANFAAPAVLNGVTGWYESNAMPTSVVGTLTGIFLNDGTDPIYNGYYRFNFTLTGPGSWAADSGALFPSGGDAPPGSFWAAPAAALAAIAVPGPGKLALLGLSLMLALMAALQLRGTLRPSRGRR